jgi:PAS domain S-box-containing protein
MFFQLSRENKIPINRTIVAAVIKILLLTATGVYLLLTLPFNSPLQIILLTAISFTGGLMFWRPLSTGHKQAQEYGSAIRQQQTELKNLINYTSEAIITTDEKGNINYMNAAAEHITGYSFSEVKNTPIDIVYTAYNNNSNIPVQNIVSRVLKTGNAVYNESNIFIYSKNKQKLFVTNTCISANNGMQKSAGAVLLFKDNTPLHALETQLKNKENENRSLIQQLPVALYTCNEKGHIQYYNKAAVKLWGKEPVPGREKWCGSSKMFYADGKVLEPENSPMALVVKQKKILDTQEIIIEKPSGQQRRVAACSNLLYNAEGQITGGVNLLLDITEQKNQQVIATLNEDKYRTLVDQASEAIFITDEEGNLLEANERAAVMTGYTKDELTTMNIVKLFLKSEFEINNKAFKKIISGQRVVKEFTAVHKNKTPFTVIISSQKMSDGRLMAIVKDVSEFKQIEKSLEESEQLSHSILTTVSSHIAVVNQEGEVITANKAWNDFRENHPCTLLERKAVGENLLAAIKQNAEAGDGTSQKVLDGFNKVISARIHKFELEYNCTTAEKQYWFFIRITPFAGTPHKVVISHVDITERKNAEKETLNYQFALDQSSIVGVANNKGIITYVNDNFCRVSGYLRSEIIGKNYALLNTTHHSIDFFASLWKTVSEGKVWSGEIKNITKNGTPIWLQTTLVPFLSSDGKPIQFISISSDISLRKAAEEEVRTAMERYTILSEATSDTIWDWDIENDKIIYNEGITKMLGYQRAEINDINTWWRENIHKDDLNQVNEAIQQAFKTKNQNLQLEYRFKCDDGTYKYILDRGFIIYHKEKPLRIIGAMQDVTYKKEEEKRISKATVDAQEAERQYLGMELHDNINQLLTGTMLILGAASHAPMQKDDIVKIVEESKGYLEKAVKEIRNLSHRLAPSAFANSIQYEYTLLINEVSKTSGFDVMHHFSGINEKKLSTEIKICLYRILQEQLSNISKHAAATNIQVSLIQKTNKIILKIIDDGVGFNPKKYNSGIGLNNIKKRTGYFNGRFTLSTAPGKGCSIEVEIPVITTAASKVKTQPAA